MMYNMRVILGCISLQGLEVVLELGLQVGGGGAHQVVHVNRLVPETCIVLHSQDNLF